MLIFIVLLKNYKWCVITAYESQGCSQELPVGGHKGEVKGHKGEVKGLGTKM